MNTKEAQLFNNKNMNKYDQYTFLFLFSFILLLAESVEILIISSQKLITTIFIVLKSSGYELSLCPSPMLESKQRTKYHINCEIGERLFYPMLAQDGKKMAIILPTGQWYAPSAIINDAWYCMALHNIAWYCMVLHCIA